MIEPLLIVRATSAAGLLSAMALSLPLWLTRTAYPRAPLFDFVPAAPPPLDAFLLLVLAAAVATLVWRPQWKAAAFVFLGVSTLLVLQDQSRLQPWFVEYALLLAALVFIRGGERAADACRFVLAAVYFWSGVHKMNTSFSTNVFPWLVSPFVPTAGEGVEFLGALIPFVEIAMGVSLLFPRLRRGGVVGIVLMHLFLLGVLSPVALGWNSVVAPWNVAMIVLVPALFWWSAASPRSILKVPRVFHVFLVLLPALSLFGFWDSSPSFALYSGNQLIGSVVLSSEARERIDPKLQALAEKSGDLYQIRLDDWSMAEMNVPAYPADRVLRRVARSFCPAYVEVNDVTFVVEQPPPWFSRSGWHSIEGGAQFCR